MGQAESRRWAWRMVWLIPAVALLPLVVSATRVLGHGADWRTAPRHSVGIAPDPATTPEAVVQVYAARAFGWRGAFGVQTWIAIKPAGAPAFTVLEAVGWYALRGLPVVQRSNRPADGMWYGNRPEILADLRGDGVDEVIARVERAVLAYPYSDRYTLWPGPNSNTFTAFVVREVPELVVDLPPTAIGKDFLPNGSVFAPAPSGTGYQLSLFGLLGVLVALDEGIEVNILGLTFGVDVSEPALKLPGLGRLDLFPRDNV